ncbi:MAG: hypothetical protein ABIJ08_00280 [Nanoarchaeota archaeon]
MNCMPEPVIMRNRSYSYGDLFKIVNQYRESVRPMAVDVNGDVKKFPNDILMSYIMQEQEIGRKEVANLLDDISRLNTALDLHVPVKLDKYNLPFLYGGLSYEDPPKILAPVLRHATKKFSVGYDGKLIVADPKSMRHRFPSGLIVPYFSLEDEITANMSVFDAGFGELTGKIYLRDNFVNMMLAMLDVLKKSELKEYSEYISQFNEHVSGIPIAHEIGEIEMFKRGKVPEDPVELELESEKFAKEFTEKQGIDPMVFRLYHTLRAVSDERGDNISKLVLDQLL